MKMTCGKCGGQDWLTAYNLPENVFADLVQSGTPDPEGVFWEEKHERPAKVVPSEPELEVAEEHVWFLSKENVLALLRTHGLLDFEVIQDTLSAEPEELANLLEKLKRGGDIFSPKPGHYKILD